MSYIRVRSSPIYNNQGRQNRGWCILAYYNIELCRFHMILDQNYRNIATLTSKAFQLYAQRVFAESVKDNYDKRKLQGFNQLSDDIKFNDINETFNRNTEHQEPEEMEESKLKNTLKSVSSRQSVISDTEAVYELFYGDTVYITKSEDKAEDLEEKLFLECEMEKIDGKRGVRSSEINIRKYLFKLVHPFEKFGIVQKKKVPLSEHSPLCLMNIETNQYIKVCKDSFPKNIIGFKISLSDTINSETIFYSVKSKDTFIEASPQIFTSSNFKLILRENDFFKIDVKQENKIALIDTVSYNMVATYDGCDLSFIKQNRSIHCNPLHQPPAPPDEQQLTTPTPSTPTITIAPIFVPASFPKYILNTIFPQPSNNSPNSNVHYYKSYYLRSDSNFYLSSHERKTSFGMKQMTYNMYCEGIGRYNVTVDQFTNSSIQISDAVLTSPQEHSNCKYDIQSIWEFRKTNLFSDLVVQSNDDILLMNIATQQYITYNKNSKKAKLSMLPQCCKIQINDGKYRFRLGEENMLGCRRNPLEDKYKYHLGFQSSDAYFYIEEVDPHSNRVLNRVREIYNMLKKTYKTIWLWGIEKEGNNIDYNFNRAVKDEYLLKIEISNLNECLGEIGSMLDEEQDNSSRLEEFQNLIKRSRILEMLIYFCKLFVIKMEPIKKGKKAIQDRSVFVISKRNLQKTLITILGILNRSSRNNKDCSSIIIQFSHLFNSLLTTYPEEVGSLLRESIKNLSILNLNYKGEELFQWVKLLEKPREDNIKTLNIYISIVAEVVIDPSDRGIQPYQIKCVEFLFNLHGNMKIKNFLLSFHLTDKDEAVVEFSYATQEQLIENNPILKEVACGSQKAYCSLSALSSKSKTNPSLNYYLVYVYEVIRLYRNLCKDRNKKMSSEMQAIGIKESLIVRVIRCQNIDSNLKMAFLSLYLQIYIDQDPFVPFSRHQNRCIRYQSIPTKKLNDRTISIFFPSIQSNKSTIQLSKFIIFFIDGYISLTLNQLETTKIVTESMCTYFIYIIKFLRASVDFGYFEIDMLIFKIEGIIMLLLLLIDKILDLEPYDGHISTIVQEMAQFLLLYKKMIVQISILHLLKIGYSQTKEQFTCMGKSETDNIAKYIIGSYLNIDKVESRDKDKGRTENSGVGDFREELKIPNGSGFRRCEELIQEFFVKILTSLHHFKNKPFYKNLINVINENVQVNKEVKKELDSLEIILDKESARVADELNDNPSTRILNANKVEHQVAKLIGEQDITPEDKTSLIVEMTNLIRKLIKKLKEYRCKGKRIVNVAQRIIMKNGTFGNFKKILIHCIGEKELKDLVVLIHQFCYHMVLDNEQLATDLSRDIKYFFKILDSCYISDLLAIIFPHITNPVCVYKELIEAVVYKNHIRACGLKIIRNVLMSSNPESRKRLDEMTINTLILESGFKPFFHLNNINDETRQFVKLLVLLLPNNRQLSKQVKIIFPQRELEHRMIESPYEKKSVYLQLLLHIHFLNSPGKHQFFCDPTLTKLILPELQNFFPRINEFFDERLLKHMKLHDQRKDASDIEEKYKKIKEIVYEWKISEFKDHQESFKKRPTKKKTQMAVEESHSFWEYFYSWDSEKYYFVDFIKEALELGVLKLPHDTSPSESAVSSESAIKDRREEISPKETDLMETNKYVSEYVKIPSEIESDHQNSEIIKQMKTQPISFKQMESIKPVVQTYRIKALFREISCLISRLIIVYDLKCEEIIKLNGTLAEICILLDQPSVFEEDRQLIDRIFRESQLSRYKSSKTQPTYLQKNFYLLTYIFYRKVNVREIFKVFQIDNVQFITYCDQGETLNKISTISRKRFVSNMEELFRQSDFNLTEVIKPQHNNKEETVNSKNLEELDYVFKAVRINLFSELYTQLWRITKFRDNYYWFVKKLIDTMRCIKNKEIEGILQEETKKKLEYRRKYWIVEKWMDDFRLELNESLISNQGLKMEEYAAKLRNVITQKIGESVSCEAEMQELFRNFVEVYRIHGSYPFMDRLMLVYFEIIHERKLKVNIPLSLVEHILTQLSLKHSSTIVNIIKTFFSLAKIKFVGAQVEWETLKTVIIHQLKYIEDNFIQSSKNQIIYLTYFQNIIQVVEAYKELPNTRTEEIITFLALTLKDILERLSENNKHPHLIFKTAMHYLEQTEQQLSSIFQCKSYVKYIKQVFERMPVNILATPMELREDIKNVILFLSIPSKLRSLKQYHLIEKVVLAIGLQQPFLKLMGNYIEWKSLSEFPAQSNQSKQEFGINWAHSMIMIFEIVYQMYHINANKFKESIEGEIKYLQLYSQSRLKVDSLTKEIKTQSKAIIQYGDQIVLQAFQFYIHSNSRIQIIKNQKPIEMFFSKPQVCNYFNEDIKEEVLKEIDQHHKQNLYQYIYDISKMVSNSLKIQESLKSFGIGRIMFKYQRQFDMVIFFVLLALFSILIILQCTDEYMNTPALMWPVFIVFVLKLIVYIAKIFNLLRGFCKFKKQWFLSFIQEISSYNLVIELITIVMCLLSCFQIEFLTLVFFFETISFRTIREFIKTVVEQYRGVLKYFAFIIVSCIFAAILFAYYDGGVLSPADYFTTALSLMNGHSQLSSSGKNIYLQNHGGILVMYLSKYIFCILAYTIMASIISSSVQTNSKHYLYNCLICLKPKETFAMKGSGAFKKHIIQEHNFWNYIFYFIYLEERDQSLMTMDDLFAEKCVREKNWLFLKMAKHDHF